MHFLQFTAESSSNGMIERDFTLGDVPGVLWSPASGAVRAPLILMGHGGGKHKKCPAMAGRAQRLVTGCGFHVAVRTRSSAVRPAGPHVGLPPRKPHSPA